MGKKYSNYRNPVVHNCLGSVTCVKNGKEFSVNSGTRLNCLSSIRTGSDSQVSIVLDDSAQKGKLCGIVVGGNGAIGITAAAAGITVEVTSGTCTEVNAEHDKAIPPGLNNNGMGVRG